MLLAKLLEYLSRKFVLVSSGIGTSFYLAATGNPQLAVYGGIVTGLIAIYQGGDSYQKYTAAKHGDPTAKEKSDGVQ